MANPEIDEQAMAVLKRMTAFLAQAPRFSVTVDTGFDVVQDSGQKIEFGETRQMVLRRPDRLRIDVTKRDGSKGGMLFDGKDIAVFNTKENVYATVASPGTVDDAIAYFLTDLDMRLPLADWLDSQFATRLPERVRAAIYVEPSQIAGVPCDHLALRGDEADLQLWVAQGAQPLPRRLVITYKREDGHRSSGRSSASGTRPRSPTPCLCLPHPRGRVKIAFARSRGCSPVAAKRKDGESHARAAMDILDSLEWPGLDGRVGGCAGRSPARRWEGWGRRWEGWGRRRGVPQRCGQ